MFLHTFQAIASASIGAKLLKLHSTQNPNKNVIVECKNRVKSLRNELPDLWYIILQKKTPCDQIIEVHKDFSLAAKVRRLLRHCLSISFSQPIIQKKFLDEA